MKKTAFILPALLALHACGGGGSGGSAPPPSSTPPPATQSPVFVIESTVTMTADAGVGSNPIATLDATTNVPLTETQQGAFTMTTNGLEQVFFSPRESAPQSWETIFYFKDPSEIGPGVYTDTVRVGLCTDTTCTALQSNTISTITVTYTVTGTVPPPPAVVASTNSVSATAMAYTDERPSATVPLTYLHQRANRSFSVTTSSAYTGALNSQVINATSTGAELQITFKPARMLEPGVYDDVITVDVCSKCPEPVEGSPLTVHTRYTITNAVEGPNGYRIRLVPHASRELAWDSNSERLYLAVPADASAYGSSLIAVDPETGEATGSVSAGMDPWQLSVSADGLFAYVASHTSNEVRRFNLPGLTLDMSIPLGTGPQGELAMREMQVSPYDATLLAIERQVGLGDGNRFDIGLIDKGVVRPYVGDPLVYGLQWADATRLHGNSDNNSAIGTITIVAREISSHSITPLIGTAPDSDERTHWDGTFLYRDNGEKIDVAAGTLEGVFTPLESGERVNAVVPDTNVNRLFALISRGTEFHLQSYELDTMQPIASVPLAGVPIRPLPQLIRFGTDGLATHTSDGRLVLLEGAFVAP